MVVVLFAPGDVFEGYQILRVLLPEGEVQRFLASAEAGGEVLLYCRPKRKAETDEVTAFEERVSLLRGLDHANVPRFQRAGYAKGSFFWIAVAAPAGRCVREVLGEDPELANLSNVIVLETQLAGVMAAAFEKRIAHFGLTPADIYVDEASLELTSVLGLGVRMTLDAAPAHPREAIVYRAPEQLREKRADYRADMYAFGMILYELIVGEPPLFDQLRALGVTDVAQASDTLLDALTLTNPTRLGDRVDGLEVSVEKFVLVMINKKPEQRPATWEQVLHGLANVSASIAMKIALRGPEERALIEDALARAGAVPFRAIVASYEGRSGEAVALLKEAGEAPDDAEELEGVEEPSPESGAPVNAAPELPTPIAATSAEAQQEAVSGRRDGGDSGSAPSHGAESLTNPQPSGPPSDGPSPASSREPAASWRVPGLLIATCVLAAIAASAGLLWLVHPGRFGAFQAPVVVQVPVPSLERSPDAPPSPTIETSPTEDGVVQPPVEQEGPPLPPTRRVMHDIWQDR